GTSQTSYFQPIRLSLAMSALEESFYTLHQTDGLFCLTFPYYDYSPARSFKNCQVSAIAFHVGNSFGSPVRFICCWNYAPILAVVHVKKATIYIYYCPMSQKHEV